MLIADCGSPLCRVDRRPSNPPLSKTEASVSLIAAYRLAASGSETRRAVDGEEQSLDLTMREQRPVEGVAGDRLGLDRRERVAFVDRDDPDAEAVEKLGQGAGFVRSFSC